VEVETVWEGDVIQCSKTYNTRGCRLCMEERLRILEAVKQDPHLCINKSIDLMASCPHRPEFHDYYLVS
jgi:hypothetical protein